ncbi:MAG: HEAT repeat domain-containing protein [Rhodospirillales bacterium]
MQTNQQPAQTTPQPAAQPKPKPVPPPEFQAANITALDEAGLIALLKDPKATAFQKAKACQRLASIGTEKAAPALAALLADPQLAHYARYGLEPLPGQAADLALRNALSKLKGKLLVGAINSIGVRRDAGSVDALAKLMSGADTDVAIAAAAALGSIGNAQAAKALQNALARTKEPVRAAVARAGLVCAERLLAEGSRDQALAFYDLLTRSGTPKPVRLAAMHGIIAAEISLSRPR